MIEIRRRENETVASLLRRFTRRVQQSGILITARKTKFYIPKESRRVIRERALRRREVARGRARLAKLGKLREEVQ